MHLSCLPCAQRFVVGRMELDWVVGWFVGPKFSLSSGLGWPKETGLAYVGKDFIGVSDVVRCLDNDGASLIVEHTVNDAVIALNMNDGKLQYRDQRPTCRSGLTENNQLITAPRRCNVMLVQ